MNDPKAFVDTNIFVYLYSAGDDIKRHKAYLALRQYNCQISTQVLSEFSNVCIRKWKESNDSIQNSIE